MIELNKNDVKAIARNRFWLKYQWWFYGALLGLVVLTAILGFVLWWTAYFPIAALVVLLGLVWRSQSRRERKLINDWKKSLQS